MRDLDPRIDLIKNLFAQWDVKPGNDHSQRARQRPTIREFYNIRALAAPCKME